MEMKKNRHRTIRGTGGGSREGVLELIGDSPLRGLLEQAAREALKGKKRPNEPLEGLLPEKPY